MFASSLWIVLGATSLWQGAAGASDVLERAGGLLEEARSAVVRLDRGAARDRGLAALEILFPALEAAPGAEQEILEQLHGAGRLAESLIDLGGSDETRALLEVLVQGYESAGLQLHGDSYYCRAMGRVLAGDPGGAAELFEKEVRAREAAHAGDASAQLRARGNLALMLGQLGELEAARTLQERVLVAMQAALPGDHPDVLEARGNLASTLSQLQHHEAARALEESVLAAREKAFPAGHPVLAAARHNLAVTRSALGDIEGARALEEAALAAWEEALPQDHPYLLEARSSLAARFREAGELEAARRLQESVLAARERSLPTGHPDILRARRGLAGTLDALGDLESARALEESLLADLEAQLPEGHPEITTARHSLAGTLRKLGELDAARSLWESVLADQERRLAPGHPYLQAVRASLARTLVALGEGRSAATVQLPALISGALARMSAQLATSPRAAREIAAGEVANRLWLIAFLSEEADSEDARTSFFELVETLRHVSQATPSIHSSFPAREDPELEEWMAEAARLRSRLNDLVVGPPPEDAGSSMVEQVRTIALQRDRVEARIRSRLAQAGAFTSVIGAEQLARRVEVGSAAVGFLRYERATFHPDHNGFSSEPALLAHVVLPGGSPRRIELGALASLEELARAWRDALGKPLERGLGIFDHDEERDAGEALRARLLDPVLAAVGDVRTLHVCLDDLLCLVPLDALPLAEGRVGDRYRIVSRVSFEGLIAPASGVVSTPRLVAVGGPSYDSGPTDGMVQGSGAQRSSRARPGQSFAPLVQARLEVETLAALFDEAFGVEAEVLMREKATKAALRLSATRARFLHIATHGWFAPETVRSTADPRRIDDRDSYSATEEAVVGLAPLTLCGLALAGANGGRDALGRVPGILTGEELASLDLTGCELAVLSACETNVGLRRAGQGILSLQAALHMAGARRSVTSLWRVDDALTRRLMELFYTNLWLEGLPVAEALWEAKRVLRQEGAAVRDWAGWVLTGDPD